MSSAFEIVVRSVLIGTGATLVMDAWAAILRRFGVPSLQMPLLGRWVAYLPRGRFVHDGGIASTPAVRGERLIGLCAHYAIGIGIGIAALLLLVYGLQWAH